MKNKKIIIPAILLALTAAAISPFISAQAATTDPNNGTSTIQKVKNFIGHKNKIKTPLTTAQIAASTAAKATREAKVAAVNTALAHSDYNAWVTAVTALNVNQTPNVKANAKAKAKANDNAKVKTNITQKITAANFPKLVEAYNLEKQLQAKLTELGLNDNGKGMMLGLGMGFNGGMGFGLNK